DGAPPTERWEIQKYLGNTEAVGGRVDGEVGPVAFQFHLVRLETAFDQSDECSWTAFPAGTVGQDAEAPGCERSYLTISGRYRENALKLRVFGAPPAEAAPGLRQYADGSWEAV